uniref:Uncharacterized protein n=1 Tax=Arundo donax TaxID=35708 RepID=A0A0A8YSE9_ARUDO
MLCSIPGTSLMLYLTFRHRLFTSPDHRNSIDISSIA